MDKKPHFIFQFTNRCGKIWFRHSFMKIWFRHSIMKITHLPVYTSAAKECSTEGLRKGSLDSCRGTSPIVIHPSPCHTCRWTSSEAFGRLDYATITQMQRERERERRYKLNSGELTKLGHLLLRTHVNNRMLHLKKENVHQDLHLTAKIRES